MPTIRDVAAAAGVSTATVSRVINGHRAVDPGVAQRVRAVVKELGYRPNLVARSLRMQTTPVIALIIPDVQNPFFIAVCRGVEDTAQRNGYSVILCNADENVEKESKYISVLAAQAVAGVIISPACAQSDVSAFVEAGIDIVTLDRRLDLPTDFVHSDSRSGARLATSHLLAGGAHRVGCITGPRGIFTSESRIDGYRAALRQAGITPDEDIVAYADFREAGGYQATRRMLELAEPPDGLFVGNNLMTLGAVRALREQDIHVPQDVSLVGFDDLPWADFATSSITTVRQPTYQLGESAAQLLLERIDGTEAASREVVFQPELVVRSSSVKPGLHQ